MDEPKVKVDLKELLKNTAVESFRDRLLKKLEEDDDKESGEKESSRDQLKRSLRDLFD